ncbi:eCIS core domain-containing protein [Hyalangium versicolor]|uniref:eCIS core domain-containing protein n=1 Tax=Hyalangium versicolor TaxID=2861190 RepID=UPI001CCC01D9|nr:DUF4157 domain-containing protein [Hyalangium versicolor]
MAEPGPIGSANTHAALDTKAAVHVAERGGEPLPEAVRAYFEPRFGRDFSQVRVHSDSEAAVAASTVQARAYTLGNTIVFGRGQYAPNTTAGKRLLSHELTHVVQQSPSAARSGLTPVPSQLVQRDVDPTAKAHYPTVEERTGILDKLNPVQSSVPPGKQPPAVDDPDGFVQEMAAALDPYIAQAASTARSRENSGIVQSKSDVQSVADIAEREVGKDYSRYMSRNPQKGPTARLRDNLHIIPTTDSPETLVAARDWVESRMQIRGASIMANHHVISGTRADCSAPGESSACRDRALFERAREQIVSKREQDLRTIILNFPAYEHDGTAFIQLRVMPPRKGDTREDALAAARWDVLKSTIHEMLHTVTHPDFRKAAGLVEQTRIPIEGFTAYFTRQTYERIAKQAAEDDTLRESVQGRPGWYPIKEYEDKTYASLVTSVEEIRDKSNEESLRVAYFMGRTEYLGLGSWNEQEAKRRETARYPANQLGLGLFVTHKGQGYFSLRYGRILAGRGGAHQFELGTELGITTPKEIEGREVETRLGFTTTGGYQFQTPSFYVQPSLGLGVSGALGNSFGDSFRLDAVPGFALGGRIRIFRIGADARLLVPLAAGSEAQKNVSLLAGLRLSAEW